MQLMVDTSSISVSRTCRKGMRTERKDLLGKVEEINKGFAR